MGAGNRRRARSCGARRRGRARRGRAAAAVHGRRLRRLLLVARARDQPRPACSAPTRSRCLPNWRHLPVGYHGRAGTVVVSGTRSGVREARRSHRTQPRRRSARRAGSTSSSSSASSSATPSRLGEPVPPHAFAEHVFGVVLVNDWSARDLQAWEYVPLGPFLGKSFATSVVRLGDAARAARGETGGRGRRRSRSRCRTSASSRRLGPRRAARDRAQRHRDLARQRPRPLLDDAAAARARDLERRERPHRRPDGLGHDLGRRARRAREPDRADVERRAAAPARRGRSARSSRTATRSSSAASRSARSAAASSRPDD